MVDQSSAGRRWLTRHGVRTYPFFRSMPVMLRFFFMVGCGLEFMLASVLFDRVAPNLRGIADWFIDTPHLFAQLEIRTALLLVLAIGCTAWLAAVWWISRGIFHTCERSLNADLFG